MENVQLGDVVKNSTSGCGFVVEEGDISIVNSESNVGNYTLIHSRFRGQPDSYNGYKAGDFVFFKKKILGIIPSTTRYKIMRSPDDGKLSVTTKVPYCLACNRRDGLLKDFLDKYRVTKGGGV